MRNIDFVENCEIKKYSTFKIGGKARCVWLPKTKEELIKILTCLDNPLIVGSGSNTLFSSSFIDRDIIITSYLDKFDLNGNILNIEAGVKTPMVANFLFQNGLTGLEFLIGFPARFGGAIYQNASAQGQAIQDTFISAEIFDKTSKQIIEFSKDEMQFGYRSSILQTGNYVLLSAKFALSKANDKIIKSKIRQNLDFRAAHQPMLSIPNVGSIFKNPENNSAGKLIDDCNLKSLKIGGAQIWENHANFIVNEDNATSLDVLKLMYKMKCDVLNKFNVSLIPEIIFVEGDNEEEKELWKLLQK